MLSAKEKRNRRHRKIRAKISGTSERPRLCVFKSAKHIYVQLVDDIKGKTILSASDKEIKETSKKADKSASAKQAKAAKETNAAKETKRREMTNKVKIAYETGRLIARKAKEKKIEKIIFDRGGYKYHGRIKAAAEGAREKGLKF